MDQQGRDPPHPEQALDQALDQWTQRLGEAQCASPSREWWNRPLDRSQPLPTGCVHHPNRVAGVLGWLRRALTVGPLSPARARAALTEYADQPEAGVEDRWALAVAGATSGPPPPTPSPNWA